jgi:hypothetical protein
MYIFRSDNRLEVPITLHLFKGMAEEVTLIDSGTTENFIDQETVKKLKLGSKKLREPVRLRNIDGTYNQSESVTHFIDLLVNREGRKMKQQFYITNLGSDRIILGYPWLHAFNPDIDWPNCKLVGPKVKMETVMAWLPRPGIRTYIFLTRLPTLLSRSVTSYLALYPQ